MRFRPDTQLIEDTVDLSHHLIDSVRYQLSRTHGVLDRLELAIDANCVIEPESLTAIHMANDADELRKLADKIELARARLLTTERPRAAAE